jgi:hypothetical protein
MAVFQVPQFLDSGDKIAFGLSLRQFAYALGGFILCFVLFTFFRTLGGDLIGLFFVAPFAFVFSILALGHYNGRDAEVYLLKLILYVVKPRELKYKKQPQTPELDLRLTQLNPTFLNSALEKRLGEVAGNTKTAEAFKNQDLRTKVTRIREISQNIDDRKGVELSSILTQNTQNDLRAQEVLNQPKNVYGLLRKGGTELAKR